MIASGASVATCFLFVVVFFYDNAEQFKPVTGEETRNNHLTQP